MRSAIHSVERHMRLAVDEYDAAIRVFIPHYEEMHRTGVELLAGLASRAPRVLDLGGGTGALSRAILEGLPEARVELLDIDTRMLDQARARLARYGDRVRFREGRFTDPLPESDAVVASLALHHVCDLGEKTRLYAAIRGCLAPGGVFLNLDATVSADPSISALTHADWAKAMGTHGVTTEQAREHFAEWAREDRYFPLHEELAALARAGFADPECFWRRAPMTIYGGIRERSGAATPG